MERLLQEFAQYLRERLLLPESGVDPYVGWVRRFLPFAAPIRQYVFPASRLSVDPRSGTARRHHIDTSVIQRAFREAARRASLARHVSRARTAPSRPRRRSGTSWPPGHRALSADTSRTRPQP